MWQHALSLLLLDRQQAPPAMTNPARHGPCCAREGRFVPCQPPGWHPLTGRSDRRTRLDFACHMKEKNVLHQ